MTVLKSALVEKCSLVAALAAVLSFAGVPATQAQPVLYGSTSGNFPGGGLVGTVNQTTAQFTLLGDPTADGPLPAIAINSAGQMFGSNNIGAGNTGVLIRIDLATGLLQGTVGPIVDTADAAGIRVSDMGFQPGTDILFGYAANGAKEGSLYTINTTTGAATLVGATGLERGGMAFAPDGTLYVATVGVDHVPVIARINPANGSVIGTPANLDQNGIEGLAVRPSDGVVFGTAADSDQLYTINPVTGIMTFIGDDGAPNSVAGLAFVPGALVARSNAPTLSHISFGALFLALLAGGCMVLTRRASKV